MAKKKRLGSVDADELLIFIDNEQPLYRRKMAIFTNLTKHVCRGNFTKAGAAKAMKYLADDAGKQYMKEYGTGGNFSVAHRKEAANELAAEYLGKLKDCTSGVQCNDLPSEAAALLKKAKCIPGGELGRARRRR